MVQSWVSLSLSVRNSTGCGYIHLFSQRVYLKVNLNVLLNIKKGKKSKKESSFINAAASRTPSHDVVLFSSIYIGI